MSNLRVGKSGLLLLAFVVLAGSIYHAAERGYFYLIKPDQPPGTSGMEQLRPPSTKISLASIRSARLFGRKVVKAAPPPKQVVAKTRLKLTLNGIIWATRPEDAKAIISGANKRPRTYSVGDTIRQTDARIDSIERGKVVLERGGRLEKLELAVPVLDITQGQKMPTTPFIKAEQ
ncbi:MAG: hypothetical protein DSZ32_01680 [Gammaproteobacteria bacterium]|nr:MAG: hypothetical protein DSZ32_01680 [Gammaproteobacteria bacterium]